MDNRHAQIDAVIDQLRIAAHEQLNLTLKGVVVTTGDHTDLRGRKNNQKMVNLLITRLLNLIGGHDEL